MPSRASIALGTIRLPRAIFLAEARPRLRSNSTACSSLPPASLSALRTVLSATRQRGHATEDGEVTPGLQSVAAAVLDHNAFPIAGVAVTYPVDEPPARTLADAVVATAATLTRRLHGR